MIIFVAVVCFIQTSPAFLRDPWVQDFTCAHQNQNLTNLYAVALWCLAILICKLKRYFFRGKSHLGKNDLNGANMLVFEKYYYTLNWWPIIEIEG